MNRAKALEEDVKSGLRIWGDVEDSHGVNRPKEDSSCRSCNLVKWYPPLLTMSTVMAGVFCWLYVTKPVMITKTVIPPMDSPSSRLVSSEPDLNGDVVVREASDSSPTVFPVVTTSPLESAIPVLSPEMAYLPGEEAGEGPQFESPVPGQDVQAVRIQRNTRSLFQPLGEIAVGNPEVVSTEPETIAARLEMLGESVSDEDLLEENSEFTEEVDDPSSEYYPSEANLEVAIRPAIRTRKVAISLMGELISEDEPEGAIIASSLDDEGRE